MRRRRLRYVALATGTMALGLLVHRHGAWLDATSRDVLGDALWAAMIAWWIGAAAPRASLTSRSAWAYAVCATVEVSQLWHTARLDAVRAMSLGHLSLGSGFDGRDLVAYAVGVLGAALLDAMARRRGAG